jgi:hypothetical protein
LNFAFELVDDLWRVAGLVSQTSPPFVLLGEGSRLVYGQRHKPAARGEINPFGPGTGASLFDWHAERRLLQAGHDLWGDLDSAAAAKPSDIDAWTKTVACRVGDGDDEQTVVVRLATRPNPRVDSSFLSSFGIDILVPALDDDDGDDDEDEDEDDDDDEEEEDENQEAIDEFVDEFVVEANLRPVVREHCAGRFVRRRTPEFVAGAVASVQADPAAQAWLRERGLDWAGPVEKAVARAAKQWYAYSIATSS